MKKGILLLVASMLVFSFSAMADVIQIDTVNDGWSNAKDSNDHYRDGSEPGYSNWITNNTPTGDDVVRWGGGGSFSSYTWAAESTPIYATVGEAFILGTFTHNNQTIAATYPSLKSVNLDIEIGNFTDPTVISTQFNFFHNETPNDGADPRDIVTISNIFWNEAIKIDGVDYFFSVLGLGKTASTLSLEDMYTYRTDESAKNETFLWAIITTDPLLTPEPASLVLFGTGLGILGLTAWRRKK